ncbi:MAG: hypothetical protein AAF549_00855 [Pseudomonadota bacterium]
MSFQSVKYFFDPLRLHCTLNFLGDVFITLSGIVYGNPLRALAAIMGSSAHILGILFSKKVIFGFAITDLVMGVVFLCGVVYFLSGTNIMNFEETPRFGEMIGGICVSLAAFSVISQWGKTATLFFTLATTSMSFSAFEVLFTRGEGDWFVLAGSLMFYCAGFVANFIKKDNHEKI